MTEFPVPSPSSYLLGDITAGPDGNLWFTEFESASGTGQIGRITPGGQVTLFPLPMSGSKPGGITAGPDGNLWFTDAGLGQIGRITSGK